MQKSQNSIQNIPEPGYRISEVCDIVREKYRTKTTQQGILYLINTGKLKEGEHYFSIGSNDAKRRSIKISREGLERTLTYFDLKNSDN